ncbi:PIF1 [Symbiodinium sp. CCMP2592]|nr:PIF1 [Symbiodinium sp. CCMP2592]
MAFANAGNSCFVNAGLQAMFALPGFDALQPTTATERALLATRSKARASTSAILPQPVLDLYYRHRQEDCAEFLVELLWDCPSIHRELQGTECGCLACTTCNYRRALPAEQFLTLQVSLVDNVGPLRSVQSAIEKYLNQATQQEDILEWQCTNPACTRAGTDRQPPLRLTTVPQWPENLIIVLKRWDAEHGVLHHNVFADEELQVAHGACYRLRAVVCHIGETAASGHYVAYRPHGNRFQRLDDANISEVAAIPGKAGPTPEKAYIVCYTRADDHPDVARAPALKRPAIELDPSDDSDNSDVLVTSVKPESVSNSGAAVGASPLGEFEDNTAPAASTKQLPKSRKKSNALLNYTEQERNIILKALQDSDTFQASLDSIRKQISKFTLSDPSSQYRLHRNTLMRWFRRPELAHKAAARQVPASTTFSRKPSWRSSLGNLPAEQQVKVVQGITAGSPATVLAALESGSGERPVPPGTLRRWLRFGDFSLPAESNDTQNAPGEKAATPCSHETWKEEYATNFSLLQKVPQMRHTSTRDLDASGLWLLEGSWTFCPSCGRKRARVKTQRFSLERLTQAERCRPSCDVPAEDLLAPAPANVLDGRLMVYTTPQSSTWHCWSAAIASGNLPLTLVLSEKELQQLAVLTIHVDWQSRRGGKAEITSKQKKTLTRCRWQPRPLRELSRNDLAAKAFTWLLQNNDTYRAWVDHHAELFQATGELSIRELQTAELLLRSPGIEVAARPWLYPLASLADTDYQERLTPLGWTNSRNKPSIRAGFMRKLESRCIDYCNDFALQCLLYDVCLAKTISSVQAIAEKQKVAPEQIASDMDGFEIYWQQQLRKMEDICRQEHEKTGCLSDALPSVFFTIAPAEWRYLLHNGMFHEGSLTDQQQNITLHLYHTLQVLLEHHILKNGASLAKIGIARVRQWSFRFEFQSRGTLHLHAVLWADLLPGWNASDVAGRSDTLHGSAFVRLLEDIFRSRVDVQCGDGSHNLLQYVAGYVSKASDALSFSKRQAQTDGSPNETSKWRQTYRLLCKRSPMEQEVLMEFAGLPMVRHSFSGHALFAPIPGSEAKNSSREQYLVYQHCLTLSPELLGCAQGLSYMQWLRRFRVVDADKKQVARRNVAGPTKNFDCGVAMTFPFELLDIFVGAWAATFLPDVLEFRLMPDCTKDQQHYPPSLTAEKTRRASFTAPAGCQHLKAVLCLDEFQLYRKDPLVFNPNVGELLARIETELILRGLTQDRIATFKARVQACALLLCAVRDGREDANLWQARSVAAPPRRIWSKEQQQVLQLVHEGTTISDAATMEKAHRILQVAGGPGTGKTEVIIAAVRQALEDGCRVLIAGPIGLLVSMYRLRLPNLQNLTMETVHSAFRITREADAAYVPPGRLRHYDLIVIDEVSQIEASVWRKLKTGLGELSPSPFIVFVGDFQQLQPLHGGPELQDDLDREKNESRILFVKLQHHEAARSVDPAMLDFLEQARVRQPSRQALLEFFQGRTLPTDANTAAQHAATVEAAAGGTFTFLTVTNQGAAALNLGRLASEFPDAAALLRGGGGLPAESGKVTIDRGMRLRLTQNIDKDRGFVNGNTGVVRNMLRSDVFVLDSDQGIPILVHPITQRGKKYLPVAYGWATTMRRAQGATLDKVGLWFDRRLPDRGYAYVGLSRAKRRADVWHLGKIRRTDWRPVNGQGDPDEQQYLSALSESTHSSDMSCHNSESESTHSSMGCHPSDSSSTACYRESTESSTLTEPSMYSSSEYSHSRSLAHFLPSSSEDL